MSGRMTQMRNAVRGIFVFAGLFLASVSGAQAFTIQEVTSPGGIKAWLVEEHAIPLMAMNYSFKGGTERDPAGKEGVSEFLTGMMDEGAGDLASAEFQKKRNELAFRMRFDAGSDFFEGGFQTLTKNRDASTDLLKLAITAPRFDAEPLERVRQQFLLNVKEQEQDPSSIGWQAWMEEILPGDPYSRRDQGTEASLTGITAATVMATEWNHAYPRELAAFPLASLKQAKYWPPVGRVDNVYGDRNLFCSCVPVSELAASN